MFTVSFKVSSVRFLLLDDFLPVPLIHEDGVDIVGNLITPDGVHVGVKTLPVRKTVFFERVALPFGERLNDLGGSAVLLLDIEGDRALHTV